MDYGYVWGTGMDVGPELFPATTINGMLAPVSGPDAWLVLILVPFAWMSARLVASEWKE